MGPAWMGSMAGTLSLVDTVIDCYARLARLRGEKSALRKYSFMG